MYSKYRLPSHVLWLITLTIFGENSKLLHSSLCVSFHRFTYILFLKDLNILLSIFSQMPFIRVDVPLENETRLDTHIKLCTVLTEWKWRDAWCVPCKQHWKPRREVIRRTPFLPDIRSTVFFFQTRITYRSSAKRIPRGPTAGFQLYPVFQTALFGFYVFLLFKLCV
jgi:hypothetical protein